MLRSVKLSLLAFAAAGAFTLSGAAPANAQSGEPIKIGFGMALTGPLAGFGKQALLGMKIWEEETNAKGGLLGRPVKLIYYDDQSKPSTVPGIYTKLLDVDKVDLVVCGYATNMVAPAIPVVMQKKKTFVSLFALDANGEFKYPKYFSVLPSGPTPKASFTDGFFQVAQAQNPKPTTVALAAEDAEFSRNACEGARENSKKYNMKIVYDKSYPPATTDYTPIVRALQAANADLVIVCSYPLSSVGMVSAANELNYKPKMFGGAMVGLQGIAIKSKLGVQAQRHHQLRDLGAVREDDGACCRLLQEVPGARRRPKAPIRSAIISAAGATPTSPCSGQAVTGAKSIEDDKVADYLRKNEFKTIMGNWSYGPNGEWTKSGMLQVQYHDIKEGDGLDVWKGMSYQTVALSGRTEDRQRDLPVREGEEIGRRSGLLRDAFSSANMTPRGDLFRAAFFILGPKRGCHASHRPVPCRNQDQRSRCDGEVLHRGARHEACAPPDFGFPGAWIAAGDNIPIIHIYAGGPALGADGKTPYGTSALDHVSLTIKGWDECLERVKKLGYDWRAAIVPAHRCGRFSCTTRAA